MRSTRDEALVALNPGGLLEIFDALGRRVTSLLDEELDNGEHAVAWNAAEAASGVYCYRLAVGEEVVTRKMLLLK